MKATETALYGVLIIEPQVFEDKRGFFMEMYHFERYNREGVDRVFVQDNLSHSTKGTLRGLHYQIKRPQAQLVQVVKGSVFDVCVDVRRGSPSFGKWTGIRLSEDNRRQVFMAEGIAHGFCVLSETADMIYKCTEMYEPGDEGGVLWSDPGLAIDWPIKDPLLSDKDSQYPCLADIPQENLPVYSPH
jgi:dTDP-4-dehydrorhamnose 3,5-epimerase